MKKLPILLAGLLLLTAFGSAVAGKDSVSMAEAKEWLEGYKSAWENRDADRAAGLFTTDATYRDNPHKPAYEGRSGIHKYWSDVTADQRDVSFQYDILTTYGNTAVAHWTASFTSASSGSTITLDGIFVLDFDEDSGLCSRLREWWHLKVDKASS